MLEHGADLDGELTLALTAAPRADADALLRVRLDLRDAFDGAPELTVTVAPRWISDADGMLREMTLGLHHPRARRVDGRRR